MDQITTALLVSFIGTGIFNFIFRTWISERIKNSIKSEYDQKLETHKAILKSQADVELEKLRAQLALAGAEQQIRYNKLHELRAEIVAGTYERLKDLYIKLSEYVKIFESSGDLPKKERRELAAHSHEIFSKYFHTKLIFFPKDTAEKLEKINLDLIRVFNQFTFGVEMAPAVGGNPAINWMNVIDVINGDIKDALSDLEVEFRSLLGDD